MQKNIINSQKSQSDLIGTCGKLGSVQCDGDGLISIYNILQFTYDNIKLEDVNSICCVRNAYWFNGLLGLKAHKIKTVLNYFGMNARRIGKFKDFSQVTITPTLFIMTYWRKGENIPLRERFKFQAGHLIQDTTGQIWLEVFNPYHHYQSITQFKRMENTTTPILYLIQL